LKTALIIIVACFLLSIAFLIVIEKTHNTSTSPPGSVAISFPAIARPAVKVVVSAKASGTEEERLGARDYLDAITEKTLPSVVEGMNALCSEFHFYDKVQSPDFMLIFLITDIDNVAIGLVDENSHKPMRTRRANSIDSSYFTACGMLRKTKTK